ncbi:hypothetical protein ACFWAR_01565 [Streptomyces sp. NPDC059917]|uniref:hypothetical protein n=1 Tax=Streptomyces sp. NPDC059917 TaxID=3347002 RepID=UPI0036664845
MTAAGADLAYRGPAHARSKVPGGAVNSSLSAPRTYAVRVRVGSPATAPTNYSTTAINSPSRPLWGSRTRWRSRG